MFCQSQIISLQMLGSAAARRYSCAPAAEDARQRERSPPKSWLGKVGVTQIAFFAYLSSKRIEKGLCSTNWVLVANVVYNGGGPIVEWRRDVIGWRVSSFPFRVVSHNRGG